MLMKVPFMKINLLVYIKCLWPKELCMNSAYLYTMYFEYDNDKISNIKDNS